MSTVGEYRARREITICTTAGFEVHCRKPSGVRLLNNYNLQPGALAHAEALAAKGASKAEVEAAVKRMSIKDCIAMFGCLLADCAIKPRFVIEEKDASEDALWIMELSDNDLTELAMQLMHQLNCERLEDAATVAPFREPDSAESAVPVVASPS